jgi:single-stranded-DNA-specific exonuclease
LGSDHEIEFAEATDDLRRLIEYVGPFGIGNRRPVFWAKGLQVVGAPKVVGEHHLKLRLGDGTNEMEAIGFGLASRLPPESLGSGRLEALFQLKENEYRGRRTLQARILDLRPVGNAPG